MQQQRQQHSKQPAEQQQQLPTANKSNNVNKLVLKLRQICKKNKNIYREWEVRKNVFHLQVLSAATAAATTTANQLTNHQQYSRSPQLTTDIFMYAATAQQTTSNMLTKITSNQNVKEATQRKTRFVKAIT